MTALLTARIAGVFATRAAVFAIGLLTTYLLALVLGPTGRGSYYLAILVPVTLLTFGQLGIPSALTYFAGRGASLDGLRSTALALALVLSLVCVVAALFARDFLVSTVVAGATTFSVTLALVSVPFLFVTAFAGAILLGRQAIRASNVLYLGQAAASLLLLLAVVGLAGGGVEGAVGVYLLVAVGGAVASSVAVLRLAPWQRWSFEPPGPLLRYSMKAYPGSLASFFSYRADIFLISIILANPTAVGLYALAVSLAEMLFYVADAVSTILFPQVSAASRSDADHLVPGVCRASILATTGAALLLIPVVAIGVPVALPEFQASIAPFFVLLPGVIALSISKVLSGYVAGIGDPGTVARVAITSLAVNVAANLLLIPALGIAGAALASTISYSVNACLMVVVTSRLAAVSPRVLVVPTRGDAQRLLALGVSLAGGRVR